MAAYLLISEAQCNGFTADYALYLILRIKECQHCCITSPFRGAAALDLFGKQNLLTTFEKNALSLV